MKRIMRKNQVIITVLAVMIAIAGYLTYAGRVEVADSRDISMENTSDAKEAIAEYDTIDTAKEDATDAALTDIESLDQDIDDPVFIRKDGIRHCKNGHAQRSGGYAGKRTYCY